MAYTTLAAWDFRGEGTSTEKRNSVVGSYTLTEVGTLGWSVDGVDFSGGTGRRLILDLPVELQPGKPWIICGFRIMSATNPADRAHFCGITFSATGGAYAASLAIGRSAGSLGIGVRTSVEASGAGWGFGTMSVGVDSTATTRKTDPGNIPGFRSKHGAEAWTSDLIFGGSVDYGSDPHLVLGNFDDYNSQARIHWFAMGSGEITDGELEAIQADPSIVLGSPAGPSTAATLGINKGFIR